MIKSLILAVCLLIWFGVVVMDLRDWWRERERRRIWYRPDGASLFGESLIEELRKGLR